MVKTYPIAFAALLLTACSAPSGAPVIDTQASSQIGAMGVSASLPADPEHGELTYLGVGPMEGAGEALANGTAVVWAFEDGVSRVSIQLNIAEAPQGKVYIGWLADAARGGYEKLGTLRNDRADVRHSLKLEAQKDFKRYTSVLVTLESSAGVTAPGRTVANGILKPTGR